MSAPAASGKARGSGSRPSRGKRARSRRRQPPIEHRILHTATLCLLAAGAVMVYSASSARTMMQGQGDGTSYLIRYAGYGALGLIVMHVLSRRGLEVVRRATPVLLVASFVLLLAVLLPGIGIQVNGARRWLGGGPLQFQPSELAKIALVLYAAQTLATGRSRLTTLRGVLTSPVVVVAGVACLLLVAEPDLGTALVIAFTLAAMLVAAGVPLRILGSVAGAGAGLVLLLALVEPYRVARLTSFVNPWAHATDIGFQAVQGQIALGSGGLFGVGLGQSVQKIFYLPEAHTDFILAVIGEEIGFVGVALLLCLYGLLAYAGLRTAKAAQGPYAKLLAAGITSLILCQATLNVFVVLGMAPLTGVPLPFISYGSSNLLVLLAAMGLLLNIAGGGATHLTVVREPRQRRAGGAARGKGGGSPRAGAGGASARDKDRDADADRDRRRRDRGARRARAGGRRRAAG
jgi:cell division protein FtsW